MSDQGWMVDDGTCTPCVRGQCYRCADPIGWDAGDRLSLTCCCNEGYDLGWAAPDEGAEP